MTRLLHFFFALSLATALCTCELDEVADSEISNSAITFERTYGGADADAASDAVQLSNGDYIVSGYGTEKILKLSKYGAKIRSLAANIWIERITKIAGDKIIFCGYEGTAAGTNGNVTLIDSTLKIEKEVRSASTTQFPNFNWFFNVKQSSDGEFHVLGINNSIPFIASMPASFTPAPTVKKTYTGYGTPSRSLLLSSGAFLYFIATKVADGKNYLISASSNYEISIPKNVFTVIGPQPNNFVLAGSAESSGLPYILVINNGTTVFQNTFGTKKGRYNDIILVEDGYVAVGSVALGKNGGSDVLVTKFSLDFSQVLWEKEYGGLKDDDANKVISTQDKGLLIVGASQSAGGSTTDFYVLKTDSNGKIKK